MVSVVSSSGKPRWFHVPDDDYLVRISGDHQAVVLNYASSPFGPDRWRGGPVYSLDLLSGNYRLLSGTTSACLDSSGSGNMAMRRADGDIVLYRKSGDKESLILRRPANDIVGWDYDFVSGTLYYLQNGDLNQLRMVFRSGLRKRIALPRNSTGHFVFWQRDLHEVWIASTGGCDMSRLLAFTPAGNFLGVVCWGQGLPGVPACVESANESVHGLLRSNGIPFRK